MTRNSKYGLWMVIALLSATMVLLVIALTSRRENAVQPPASSVPEVISVNKQDDSNAQPKGSVIWMIETRLLGQRESDLIYSITEPIVLDGFLRITRHDGAIVLIPLPSDWPTLITTDESHLSEGAKERAEMRRLERLLFDPGEDGN